MLDIHPQPQHARIEVHYGDRKVDMGRLDESAFIEVVHWAHSVVASTIADGLFRQEREEKFEFLYYFDAFDEWTRYILEHDFGDPKADKPLIEATRDLMSQGQCEVVMRELIQATCYRRLEPV